MMEAKQTDMREVWDETQPCQEDPRLVPLMDTFPQRTAHTGKVLAEIREVFEWWHGTATKVRGGTNEERAVEFNILVSVVHKLYWYSLLQGFDTEKGVRELNDALSVGEKPYYEGLF